MFTFRNCPRLTLLSHSTNLDRRYAHVGKAAVKEWFPVLGVAQVERYATGRIIRLNVGVDLTKKLHS